MEKTEQLREMLYSAKQAVFFGGAGVSTESGIPDFRGTDGLYRQKWKYPPETIVSHDFFLRHTKEFYDFYRQKLLFPSVKPNKAHYALAQLEKEGHLQCVITQNIDGLHQAAGSSHVIELHGSVLRNFCMDCDRAYPGMDIILDTDGIPRCSCGGLIKPDVVLYGEMLDEEDICCALRAVSTSDLLIIGGTSLSVYPAAAFVQNYRGKLIVINKAPTPMDARADLLINMPIGEVLGKAVSKM